MAKTDLIPKQLIATVRENPNIQEVFIEDEPRTLTRNVDGDTKAVTQNWWHFNHAKEIREIGADKKPTGPTYLTVNGRRVTKFTREDILSADKKASA